MKRSVGFLFLWTFLVVMPTIAADKPRVFVVASETVDASNSRDKAKHVDFGTALSAALTKKDVPVMVVTDPNPNGPLRAFRPRRKTALGPRLQR